MRGLFQPLSHALLLILALVSAPAQAESVAFSSGTQRVTLIELFTSQGCSSCPPADAWLGNLKQHPGLWTEIVPVAFHVDYWDSLGWKDPFAQPMHTQRQYRYKATGSVNAVYTPGFVINGDEWRGWFRKEQPKIDQSTTGQLQVKLNKSKVTASFDPAELSHQRYTLNLAVLASGIRSRITAGENSGRTLRQEFVVVGFKSVPSDKAQWATDLPLSRDDSANSYAVAAWITRDSSPIPLQATGSWIPKSIVEFE